MVKNAHTYNIRGFLIMDRPNEYSKISLIIIFLIFSHIGWLWEVAVTLETYGFFANRGFMHGPWLPVYGTGVVLLIILMGRKKVTGWRIFLGSAVMCGILEYFTSLVLERVFHAKWWDYSKEFLNINGRTCFAAIILFGIAGSFVIRIVAPFLNSCVSRIPHRTQKIICLIFSFIFLADYVISLLHPNKGMGITF